MTYEGHGSSNAFRNDLKLGVFCWKLDYKVIPIELLIPSFYYDKEFK